VLTGQALLNFESAVAGSILGWQRAAFAAEAQVLHAAASEMLGAHGELIFAAALALHILFDR
jgi:hypothetical protein